MRERRLDYVRDVIVGLLRDLNEIVVSLVRLGSASARMSKAEPDVALEAIHSEWDVLRNIADARPVLYDTFSRELGPEEVEQVMVGARCWRSQFDEDA